MQFEPLKGSGPWRSRGQGGVATFDSTKRVASHGGVPRRGAGHSNAVSAALHKGWLGNVARGLGGSRAIVCLLTGVICRGVPASEEVIRAL